MASEQASPTPTPSLSNLSLSLQRNHSNPIDLTEDSDDDLDQYISPPRDHKRMRVDHFSRNASSPALFASRSPSFASTSSGLNPSIFTNSRHPRVAPAPPPEIYRPPFAGPSTSAAFFPHKNPTPMPVPVHAQPSAYPPSRPSTSNIIDLTGSPSPPPQQYHFQNGNTLPPDLDAKTPICIGQLTATALVLYPVPYIIQDLGALESWVPVKLQYEHTPTKVEGTETIHIKIPTNVPGTAVCDSFGVVEQKVATNLGGMLGKGLIRIEAKVRKGPPNVRLICSVFVLHIFQSSLASYITSSNDDLHSKGEYPHRWAVHAPEWSLVRPSFTSV